MSNNAFAQEKPIDTKEAEQFLKTLPKLDTDLDGFLKQIEAKPSAATMKEVTNFLEGGKSCSKCTGRTVPAEEASKPAENDLIVFVSLSLGKETLRRLSRDVSKGGGRLVMRGIKNNSFKAMQKAIADLQINVDIDPYLFEEFEIKHVPTFVLRSKGKFDRLSGNISITAAFDIFKEEGSLK